MRIYMVEQEAVNYIGKDTQIFYNYRPGSTFVLQVAKIQYTPQYIKTFVLM